MSENKRKISVKITPLLKERGIKSAYIFGSYARGEEGPDSDLDLLVTLGTPMGLFGFARLQRELSELAGIKIDLVTEDFLSPFFREQVIKERELIYA